MSRTFDGTSSQGVAASTATTAIANVIPGTVNTGIRRSHPKPFVLANGNLIVGHCTNEDNTAGNFIYKVRTSTDGGLTFGSAVAVTVSGSDTFEGAFAQLSGGLLFCVYGYGSDVRYRTSTDNGATWSSETTLVGSTGADPHVCCVLSGTTLTVAYISGGAVKAAQSTVTSTALGAFGSELTFVATASRDPSITVAADGFYVLAWLSIGDVSVRVARSTDTTGTAFGSPTSLYVGTGSANSDVNLLRNGTQAWATYTVGGDESGIAPNTVPGTFSSYLHISSDGGATWTAGALLHKLNANDDCHRINGAMIGGSPIWFSAAFDGESTTPGSSGDYHIDRHTLAASQAKAIADGRWPATLYNNLTTFTVCAWVKFHTNNAASNQFIYSKGSSGFDRVLQYKSGQIHLFVNRGSTATDYASASTGLLPTDTWAFVAVTFDDSRGTGARAAMFVGASPAAVASVSTSVVDEGSGSITDDTSGTVYLGSHSTDNSRVWNGDIYQFSLYSGVLSLSQIQSVAAGGNPGNRAAGWTLASASTTDADINGYGYDLTLTSTTAGANDPAVQTIAVTETTLERGQASQTLHVVGTGTAFSSSAGSGGATADWTLTGGTVTAVSVVDTTHATLTVTAPTSTGTTAVTFVPASASSGTITVQDTVAPNSPTGLTFGTLAYDFTFSWTAVPPSPSGETITYDVKKNGTTVSSGQSGTSYAATGIANSDVLGVDAKDNSGNTSTLATKTFTAPSASGGLLLNPGMTGRMGG